MRGKILDLPGAKRDPSERAWFAADNAALAARDGEAKGLPKMGDRGLSKIRKANQGLIRD
jgi:hypothetical protein